MRSQKNEKALWRRSIFLSPIFLSKNENWMPASHGFSSWPEYDKKMFGKKMMRSGE